MDPHFALPPRQPSLKSHAAPAVSSHRDAEFHCEDVRISAGFSDILSIHGGRPKTIGLNA
jgi:hypothetical protein